MILQFSVKNFRSIREKVTLSLEAEKSVSRKNELPENLIEIGDGSIHKAVVLYGRNASGKSNLLLALKQLTEMVASSENNKVGEVVKEYDPFACDAQTENAPTEFEIEFLLSIPEGSQVKYCYRISFDKGKILSENLHFYPKGQKAKLFERKEGQPISFGDYIKGNKKSIEDGLLPNQLFLSKSATYKLEFLNEVYTYLSNQIVSLVFHDLGFEEEIVKEIIIPNLKIQSFRENLLELLKAADTGIVDIQYNSLSGNIETSHRYFEKDESNEKTPIPFSYQMESLGTKKLLILTAAILNILKNGKVVLIDELDKSLHPLLSKMIVRLFLSSENNPHKSQLLFTTHDSSLMDGELFRRDQMFITEKDYMGQTSIYNLSSIQGLRKNVPFEKWYLGGSLGGIPVIYEPELVFNGK